MKRTCYVCRGLGKEWDEHGHCGSRIGEPYTCTGCGGVGTVDEELTDKQRIKQLEEKVRKLEGAEYE